MRINISDLEERKPLRVEVDGEAVCLARLGEEIFAIADTCTHQDASLSEGEIIDGTIERWLHGAQFNLRTSEALTPPATSPVKVFKVEKVDGFVNISKGESNE